MAIRVLILGVLLTASYHSASSTEVTVVAKVNKCCPLGQAFDRKSSRCLPSAEASNSTQWTLNKAFIDSENTTLILELQGFRSPACPYKALQTVNKRLKENSSNEAWYYVSNGGNLLELGVTDSDEESFVTHLPKHYCIDPLESGIIIRICPAACDAREPCIRKCCPLGYHFHAGEKRCEQSKDTMYQLPLYPHEEKSARKASSVQPRFTTGMTSCQSPLIISSGLESASVKMPFKVLTNGSIVIYRADKNQWGALSQPSDYCYDRFYHPSKTSQQCKDDIEALYFCQMKSAITKVNVTNVSDDLDWLRHLANVTITIAIVCLLLTAIVIFLLIDRVNLHSWTRLSFVTSEFIFLFLFSLINLEALKNPATNPAGCKTFAVMFHYTGLVTICWLSVINFDLWWTFKVLKPTSDRRFDIRRFVSYVCFALGLPLLIVTVALIIQFSKPLAEYPSHMQNATKRLFCRDEADEKIELSKSKWISPNYGQNSCSLSVDSLLPYWYGPLCFLLLANLLFFLTTTFRMMSLRRMTRRASVESSSGQSQSNKIFMKIFIVSGVTWNIEIIGWLLRVDGRYRLDIVHHFQAMAVFYIFVCKKGVIRNLQLKYPVIMKVIPPLGRSQRSATLASMSTDASSRMRIGRKLSSASTNSSSVVGESYQRHESFELPVTSPAPIIV